MFMQILNGLPDVFDAVPWPDNFRVFAYVFSFVNLEFFGLFSFTSCVLGLHPVDQFMVHMLVPVFLVAALCAAYATSLCCLPAGTGTGTSAGSRALQRGARWEMVAKIAVFIIMTQPCCALPQPISLFHRSPAATSRLWRSGGLAKPPRRGRRWLTWEADRS